jgi:hypothetical protein
MLPASVERPSPRAFPVRMLGRIVTAQALPAGMDLPPRSPSTGTRAEGPASDCMLRSKGMAKSAPLAPSTPAHRAKAKLTKPRVFMTHFGVHHAVPTRQLESEPLAVLWPAPPALKFRLDVLGATRAKRLTSV